MLSDHPVYATIPASDIERARRWYEEKLGLKPRMSEPMGLIYDLGGGTGFLLYPTSFAGQAPNTLMSFDTKNIAGDVADMKGRGVKFEEYDLPGLKTINSIATLGSRRGAWFKDSEGNILAIGETA
jgi:catechol 2,3-dioxygenase-like lactoylglutathione lyase family enzyme